MRPWRTIVADPVPEQCTLLRLALARDPAFDVVAEAATGHEALDLAVRCDADLLVADADLAGLDGIDVAARVRAERPACATVLLSSLPEQELAAVGGAGIVGVLPRSTPKKPSLSKKPYPRNASASIAA